MAELLDHGCTVLVPYGQGPDYDLVVDRGEAGFARIQVKTGWVRNGCVHFNSASTDQARRTRPAEDFALERYLDALRPVAALTEVA